jgi:hypothetical protein
MNLFKSTGTIRFWVPFLLAFGSVYNVASPLAEMTTHYSEPINAFSAAFLLSDKVTVFTLFVGLFILFSDLPFRENNQTFLIIRGGKCPWIFSQILYIIIVSIVYFIFVFTSYCLILIQNISFSPERWGKIVNTIAATNASDLFDLKLKMPQNVISEFTPLSAFFQSFSIAIYIAVFLGLLTFAMNLIIRHNSGLIASGFFIFLYLFLSYVNAISETMFYFSPIGWCSLILIDKNGSSPLPNIEYAVTVLTCAILIIVALLSTFSSNRVSFNLYTKDE